MMAQVWNVPTKTFNSERLFLGEGIGEGSTTILVAVQRDFVGVKNIGREGRPSLW